MKTQVEKISREKEHSLRGLQKGGKKKGVAKKRPRRTWNPFALINKDNGMESHADVSEKTINALEESDVRSACLSFSTEGSVQSREGFYYCELFDGSDKVLRGASTEPVSSLSSDLGTNEGYNETSYDHTREMKFDTCTSQPEVHSRVSVDDEDILDFLAQLYPEGWDGDRGAGSPLNDVRSADELGTDECLDGLERIDAISIDSADGNGDNFVSEKSRCDPLDTVISDLWKD